MSRNGPGAPYGQQPRQPPSDPFRNGPRPQYSGDDNASVASFDRHEGGRFYDEPYGDNESEYGGPSGRFGGSQEGMSLRPPGRTNSVQSSGTYQDYAASVVGAHEQYSAWSAERHIPLSKEEIEDVFLDLTQKFGFQRDSMRNQFDFIMHLLDSRASRMTPDQALMSLHADYIGGPHANYRKWYFAAQLDLDDQIGAVQSGGGKKPTGTKSLDAALNRWRQAMENMSQYDRLRQIALWLLLWGEAGQVRFTPECLCFIFKCADDYYRSPECQNNVDPMPEGMYLNNVIRPLYRFMRDQGYELQDNKYVRREKDHAQIIGYDDMNQLFWYPEGIARIGLMDKSRLVDVPPPHRFMRFNRIDWNRTFFKTYLEKRSAWHLLVNFNRIWISHISLYWFYTAYQSPRVYARGTFNDPTPAMQWSATALGGAVSTLIMIFATIAEFSYIPTTWNNTSHLTTRLLFLLVILALTSVPTVYIYIKQSPNPKAPTGIFDIIAFVQLAVSVGVTLLFGIMPSGRMFGDRVAGKSRKYMANQSFTAAYPALDTSARTASILLWVMIFGCKFAESYAFLTLSFAEPINAMVGMVIQGCTDRVIGSFMCKNQAIFTLTVMYLMDLTLFFLDTFLWYVIWNTTWSLVRAFNLGLSIWTPWTEVYTRLPKRIYAKLLATGEMNVKYKPKVLVSQVWNAIIISMYREHLLSIEHVQKLLYHQIQNDQGRRTLRAPAFFVAQNDKRLKGAFFPAGSEAERRISFFAQSLTTALPDPLPIENMPTFTVITPHYSEKILLSLREIIREEDQNTRVTLLEYLKQLHTFEWDNFVKDTKILSEESTAYAGANPFADEKSSKVDDLPFYCIGFKSSSPEYTLRTRIWASLRAQTLYRTISGMMNYSKALKLLYRVENPEVVQLFGQDTDRLERELERMARRKFKYIVSMQRYAKFSKEEMENAEFLMRAYPDLQIAYLDEEPGVEKGEPRIFSTLIDGHSEFNAATGKRTPRFRIELPGNPILGDGKSDNQNHCIVFYRGEYLQLIDANQDNYLEECIKIRNVLAEFEELSSSNASPYAQVGQKGAALKAPIAILGTREYIFSENIGILGDVAAGKEQTFGTLSARALSWVGGKLHYGHPDFLNALFMNTRGGVSKAQKGLHVNEDIYAGMNAFGRGGRIKHCEYYQCGKGRDLGFGTILNFQTKIGMGMGEQMLSREYYYLGTQLPMDRFLNFYYGHPGFHINNVMVILSVQVFMLCLVFLGTLNKTLLVCQYLPSGQVAAGFDGCYGLTPVFDWISRCIISIFIVFFIAFLPLFLQELTDRGTGSALVRLGKHFLSLSPIFEVFSTQIYTYSILNNLTFGGARYIATGRGFATTRLPFSILFSRFAGPSIYLGTRTLLMLLYVSLSLWLPTLIYFWITVTSLCIAPFMFNPHQFSVSDFIIDYREYLRWMSRGNTKTHANSWVGYCRLSRTAVTGYKKKKLGHPSEKLSADVPRATLRNVFFSEILMPIIKATLFVTCYCYVKSFPVDKKVTPSPLIRIAVVALGPIVLNAVVLVTLFFISLLFGPVLNGCCAKFGAIQASIAHIVAVVGLVGFFEFLWYLENWDSSQAVLGLIAMVAIQRAITKILIAVALTREYKHDETNRAWWTGKWHGIKLGSSGFTQAAREFIVKIIELTMWSSDFILGHILLMILTPPMLIPGVDKVHSTMLFWLRPSKQIRPPLFSMKQKKQRRWIVMKYGILYLIVVGVMAALIVLPLLFRTRVKCSFCDRL